MQRHFLIVASALTLATPAFAASPQDFVSDAIKGDNSEIMLGHMAMQQADSQAVKDFAQILVTDHTQAKQQMSGVAGKIGVTPPEQSTDDAQREQQKLSKLHGSAFDHEFIRYMVKDHKKDIKTFQREADSGSGPASKIAEQQLPVLERHLRMAESLRTGSQSAQR